MTRLSYLLLFPILILLGVTVAYGALAVPQGFTIYLNSTGGTGGTPPYSYQWFSKCPGCGSYNAIPSTNAVYVLYNTTNSTPTGLWQFLVQVKDSNSLVTNSAIPVNVLVIGRISALTPNADVAVPQSISVALNSSVQTSGIPPYSYQWYSKCPGCSSYNAIANAVGTQYFFNTTYNTAVGKWQFLLHVTDSNTVQAVANSIAVNVVVANQVYQAATLDVPQGFTAVINSTGGTGGIPPYTYKWFDKCPSCGSYSAISNSNSIYEFFNTTNVTQTGLWQFTLQASDSAANVANSVAPVNIIVEGLFQVAVTLTPSTNQIYDFGQSITFNAVESGGTAPFTYNFIVYNAVTKAQLANMLVSNALTSNTFIWTFNAATAGNTVYANVVVTDTNLFIGNVTSNTLTLNGALAAAGITESNTIIDNGQFTTLTSHPSSGSSPYTYQWYSNALAAPTCTSANAIGGQTASTLSVSPTSNTFYAYNVVDSATTNTMACSAANTVTVYPAPSLTTPVPSNVVLDLGQSVTYNVILSGGLGPFTVNLVSGGHVVNSLTGRSAGTLTFGSNIPAGAGFNVFNVVATDTGTSASAFVFNSASNTIIVNTVLAPTLSASITPTVGISQIEVFTAMTGGGASPYTYNYLVVNTLTGALIANQVWVSASTTNSFSWNVPAVDGGNTIQANVIVTDSASTPVTANSVKTAAITISLAHLATISVPSNAIADVGQYESFTGGIANDGASPYVYNFLVVSTGSPGTIVYNSLVSISSTSNVFAFQTATADIARSPEEANVVVTDNGANVINSIYSQTFTVYSTFAASAAPTASNSAIDVGQSTALSISAPTTGAPGYLYQWYSGASSTCTSDSSVVGQTSLTYTASPSSSTYYCVQETDSASTNEIVYTPATQVVVSALPTVTLTNSVLTINSGQSALFTTTNTPGSGGNMYQWYNTTGSTVAIGGQTSTSFNVLGGVSGGTFTYNVLIKDSNNGIGTSGQATLDVIPTTTIGGGGGGGGPATRTVTITDNVTQRSQSNVPVIYVYVVSSSGSVSQTQYNQNQLPATVKYPTNATLTFGFACSFSSGGNKYTYANSVYGIGVNRPCGANITVYSGSYTVTYNQVPANETTVSVSTSTTTSTSTSTVGGPINTGQPGVNVTYNLTTSPRRFVWNSGSMTVLYAGAPAQLHLIITNITSSATPFSSTQAIATFNVIAVTIPQNAIVNVTLSMTLKYPCGIAVDGIAPYVLKGGSWAPITPFAVNTSSCEMLFSVPSDPIVALFRNLQTSTTTATTSTALSSSSATTTIAAQKGKSNGLDDALIIVVVLVVMVIAAAGYYLSRRRR